MQATTGILPEDPLPAVQLSTVQLTRAETTLPGAMPPSTTITPEEKEALHSLAPSDSAPKSGDISAKQETHRPVGARLQLFYLTGKDDPRILNVVRGCSLELTSAQNQHHPPTCTSMHDLRPGKNSSTHIRNCCRNKAISQVKNSPGEFLSPILLVP